MPHIREADESDIDRLLPLFLEMERHYGVPAPTPTPVARDCLRAAFSRLPQGLVLIATDDGAPQTTPLKGAWASPPSTRCSPARTWTACGT